MKMTVGWMIFKKYPRSIFGIRIRSSAENQGADAGSTDGEMPFSPHVFCDDAETNVSSARARLGTEKEYFVCASL
jgi:hypothetical protein